MIEDPGGPRSFDDFRVWVEGRELNYQTEVRGKLLNGSDCSAVLRRFGIDIASFGHFDPITMISADYIKLSDSQQKELTDAGLFTPDPAWTVQKIYHWRQGFPARGTIHVRHEYAPVYGFSWIPAEELKEKMSDACVDPALQRRLAQSLTKDMRGFTNDIFMMWVDYILTTANNWKTPIKDFELLVERPKGDTKRRSRFHTWYVSFCWDGDISEIDSDHFLAKKVNFAPKRELRVFFFGVQ